jgi:hypothetical protein
MQKKKKKKVEESLLIHKWACPYYLYLSRFYAYDRNKCCHSVNKQKYN